ncbi:unnamed protein product, partial [Prorocentrum cordatum]
FSRRLGRGTPLRTPWHTRQWVPYRGIARRPGGGGRRRRRRNTRGGQWQGCLCLLGALASPRGARRQAAARTDFKDLPRRVPESDAPSAAAPGGRRAGEAGGTPWRAWRSAGGAPSALA